MMCSYESVLTDIHLCSSSVLQSLFHWEPIILPTAWIPTTTTPCPWQLKSLIEWIPSFQHTPTTHTTTYSSSGTMICPKHQFSSVTQSCLTLCDPMNHSTPGLPVYHQLPEFTQTHVHWVGDTIKPSHPLSSPSPSAPNPSQHQGLFQWVNSSHELAKVLEFQL